ncbi:uncharacterized protein [Ptychodera flava]|uniref:uncharacterized protein isoform X2 n=1 Tax=Ptychodera flava TaxID=63121 RepID=UPI003969E3F6
MAMSGRGSHTACLKSLLNISNSSARMMKILLLVLTFQLAVRTGNCDDIAMIGVHCSNKLQTRSRVNGKWRLVGGSCCVESIGVMWDGTLVGVGDDEMLYTKKSPNVGGWEGPVPNSCCVQDVTLLPDGAILGVSTDNKLVFRTHIFSEWHDVPSSVGVVAADVFSDGRILGVTQSGSLKIRDGIGEDSEWERYAASGVNVKDISIQPNDKVFGVGKSKDSLYVLEEDGNWEEVPDSDCVLSIVSPGNLIE